MPRKNPIPIERYCDPKVSLRKRFAELCDRKSFPIVDSPGVKEAVMGFIHRYACDYFQTTTDDLQALGEVYRGGKATPAAQRVMQATMTPSDPLSGAAAGSLLDTRATAALVREIAFAEYPKLRSGETALGTDFGSGSGILSAAAGINALRHGANIHMIGFDQNPQANDRAALVAADLVQERVRNRVCVITAYPLDLASEEPYEAISQIMKQGEMLRYWISETFNRSIPQPIVEGKNVRWATPIAPMVRLVNRFIDPFMEVVGLSCRIIPRFIENVRRGETVMFPDIVNERLHLDALQSALRLRGQGDRFVPFEEIGADFGEFEDLGIHTRFVPLKEIPRILGAEHAMRIAMAEETQEQRTRAKEKRKKSRKK